MLPIFRQISRMALLLLLLEQSAQAAPIDYHLQPEHGAHACHPVLTEQDGPVSYYRYVCDQSDWQWEANPIRLQADFPVPPSLSRRIQFWRRIYTQFHANEWVLHHADYPEVIFESVRFDGKSVNAGLSGHEKRQLEKRRRHYKNLLKTLAKTKLSMQDLSPELKTIAIKMSHISDKNKYQKAIRSLRLQRGQFEYIERGLAMAAPYLSHVEAAFSEEGLAPELARLAFVESSFNLKAYSKVGAAGVYQLMPFVAKHYMRISHRIDERRDPIKSAHVAARILAQNYQLLRDWPLAITAYNHGAFGLKRGMQRTGASDLGELIERDQRAAFGFASKNFYAGFLAINWTVEQAIRFFPKLEQTAPLRFEEQSLPKSESLGSIAKRSQNTVVSLLALNPDLQPGSRPGALRLPKGYRIKLPLAAVEEPLAFEQPVHIPSSSDL